MIAGSLITNNSEYLIQTLITNKVGIQNYYQSFSREQEREADYYAIETLNKLKLSTTPLVNFLNLLEQKSIQKGFSDEHYKFSSHPIYKERFDIININKLDNKNNFNEELNQRFNYLKAKLFGFTENNINKNSKYLKDEYLLYSNSIIFSKQGKLKKSLELLNELINEKYNYTFFFETKADILYSNGFSSEALLFYEKSIQKNPSNHYVNKRIFDIKFSLINKKKKVSAKKLFNEFSFLIEKFSTYSDLKNKFLILAIECNLLDWIKYFSIEEKFNNNKMNKKDFLKAMNEIKKNTPDLNLINLINNYKFNIS